MKHTEGPWEAVTGPRGKGGLIWTQRRHEEIAKTATLEDAQRIVACVNALEDLNPEAVPRLLMTCQLCLDFINIHHTSAHLRDKLQQAMAMATD